MREDLAQAILGMYEAIQRAADEQSKLGTRIRGGEAASRPASTSIRSFGSSRTT